MPGRTDHEFSFVLIQFQFSEHHPHTNILRAHFQVMQGLEVAVQISHVEPGVKWLVIGIKMMVHSSMLLSDVLQGQIIHQEQQKP